MDEFTRALKKKVEITLGRAAPWEENINPLAVIGLTQAMLDLGLTEDQMYAVVRSYARQLASQVHPDRYPGKNISEREKQIFNAFEILDNRANFSKAWNEFRMLKADERTETNALSRALAQTREGLRSFQIREQELASKRKELDRKSEEVETLESKLRKVVPDLNARLEAVHRKAEIASREWRANERRKNSLYEYVKKLSLDGKQNSLFGGGVHVFDASWVIVLTLESPVLDYISPISEIGRVNRDLLEKLRSLKVSDRVRKQVFQRWNQAKVNFATNESKRDRFHNYNFWLHVVELSSGKPKVVFGYEKLFTGGRVLGSISPEKMNITRGQLTETVSRDAMFEYLTPLLNPGELLVSEQITWHSTKDQKLDVHMKFNTKKLILGVG